VSPSRLCASAATTNARLRCRSRSGHPAAPHVPRVPAQHGTDAGELLRSVLEDGPAGHLGQPLPRRPRPVRHGHPVPGVEAELPGQPAAQAEDLNPVPLPAVRIAGDREPHRISTERRRQPPRHHLTRILGERPGVLVVQEQQQPRSPVVVGGAPGVEAEHLRAGPEQRGRVPQPGKGLVEHRAHRLGVELARQPQPGHEPVLHPAMLPRRRRGGHPVFRRAGRGRGRRPRRRPRAGAGRSSRPPRGRRAAPRRAGSRAAG
jgi:hypothetical protein